MKNATRRDYFENFRNSKEMGMKSMSRKYRIPEDAYLGNAEANENTQSLLHSRRDKTKHREERKDKNTLTASICFSLYTAFGFYEGFRS